MTTYIENRGITQTLIRDNNNENISEIKWNADYDGNLANIKLNINDNGKSDKYNIQLNNDDLANLLNIPSVERPIHQRLEDDFLLNDVQFENEEQDYGMNIVPEPVLHCPIPRRPYPYPILKKVKPHGYLYRVNTHTRPKYNIKSISSISSLPDNFEEPIQKKMKVTKRRAPKKTFTYNTPLPKTIRIHLKTPVSSSRRRKVNKKITNKNRKSSGLFSDLI
jgi:hypothetical protein